MFDTIVAKTKAAIDTNDPVEAESILDLAIMQQGWTLDEAKKLEKAWEAVSFGNPEDALIHLA